MTASKIQKLTRRFHSLNETHFADPQKTKGLLADLQDYSNLQVHLGLGVGRRSREGQNFFEMDNGRQKVQEMINELKKHLPD